MQRSVLVLALWVAAPAWAHVHPEHFRGALLGATDNIDAMSRDELEAEYWRLKDEEPSFAAPITLFVIGGVAGGVGGLLIWAAVDAFDTSTRTGRLSSGFGSFLLGIVAGAFAAVVLVVAAVLLTLAVVFLIRDIVVQGETVQRRRDLRDRVDELDRRAPQAPLPLPPPPPPPPPLSPPPLPRSGLAPTLSFVVARF